MSRKDEILKLLSGESQTTQSVNTDSSASVGGINRKDEVLHLLETGKPMDADYFTTELGKIPDFIKQSASDFKNYGYSSSDDVYNGIVSGVDNYKRTIENAKKYNPEWYEKNKVNIDDTVKALDEVYNSYTNKKNMFGKYASEDEYNRDLYSYVYGDYTYDQLQREIAVLSGSQRRQSATESAKTQKKIDALKTLLYTNTYTDKDSYTKALANINSEISRLESGDVPQVKVFVSDRSQAGGHYEMRDDPNYDTQLDYLKTTRAELEQKSKITDFTELPSKLGAANMAVFESNLDNYIHNPTGEEFKAVFEKMDTMPDGAEKDTLYYEGVPEIEDPVQFYLDNKDLIGENHQASSIGQYAIGLSVGETLGDLYWHARDFHWDQLKDEELLIYKYNLVKHGKEKALEYIRLLEPTLGQRYQAEIEKGFGDYMKEHGALAYIGLNALTVPMKMLGGVVGGMGLVDSYANGEANPYSQANALRVGVNAIRSETGKAIEENTDFTIGGHNVLAEAYNIGMSTADSTFGALAFKQGYSFVAGLGAAADMAEDIYDRGGSSNQVFWGGVAAGVAETVFEYVSIDKLLDDSKVVDTAKKYFVNILVQAGVEASEEVFTEITNKIFDEMIMDEKSEFNQKVKQLVDSGMSLDEAREQAFTDVVYDVVWAGVAGFVSGGISSGGFGAVGYFSNSKNNAEIGKSIANNPFAVTQLVGYAQSLNDPAINKMLKGKATDKNIGRIYNAVVENITNRFNNTSNNNEVVDTYNDIVNNTKLHPLIALANELAEKQTRKYSKLYEADLGYIQSMEEKSDSGQQNPGQNLKNGIDDNNDESEDTEPESVLPQVSAAANDAENGILKPNSGVVETESSGSVFSSPETEQNNSPKNVNSVNNTSDGGSDVEQDADVDSDKYAKDKSFWQAENKNKDAEISKTLKEKLASLFGKKTTDKPVSIGEIVKLIEKEFGVPISSGRFRHNAYGIYKNKSRAIRTKITNALPTIAHELGHHLDRLYNLHSLPSINEAMQVLEQDRPEFYAGYKENQRPREAVAEFLRVYLADRNLAKTKYPNFFKEFEAALNKSDLKNIQEIGDLINKYYTAAKSEVARAAVLTRTEARRIDRLGVRLSDLFERVITKLVDKAKPIKKISKMAYDRFTYALKTTVRAKNSISGYYLSGLDGKPLNLKGDEYKSITDEEGNVLAFRYLFDKLQSNEQINDFRMYLVYKHAVEWLKQDKRVFADDAINNIDFVTQQIAELEAANPIFKETAERVYLWQRVFMQEYAVKSGLVKAETLDKLNQTYPCYIPFYRHVEKGGGGAKTSVANQKSLIKRAKGSGLELYDPFENIIVMVDRWMKAADRNAVMQEIAKTADTEEGLGYLLEKVDLKQMPNSVRTKIARNSFEGAMKDYLAEQGTDAKSTDNITKAILEVFDESVGESITEFKVLEFQGKSFATVMRNGKMEVYQIHDKNLLESVMGLSEANVGNILKVLGTLTRMMKALTTGVNAIWALTSNSIRDIQSAFMYSSNNNPASFTLDYIKAVGMVLKENFTNKTTETMKLYKTAGGGFNNSLSSDLKTIRATVNDIAGKPTFMERLKKLLNVLNHIENISDAIETAPRLAEFMRTYDKTKDAKKAILAAEEITVNFNRSGSFGKSVDQVIPYFNASVQGLNKLVTTLKNENGNRRAFIAKVISSAVITTLLQVAFMHIGGDDGEEEYAKLSSYKKNNFYNFYIGDGKFISISKPKELGLMASFMERTVEITTNEDADAKHEIEEYSAYAFDMLIPPLLDEAIVFGTIADIRANEDYKGTPIVSSYYESLLPEDQYNEKTSYLARILGDWFGYSPMKIDYIINSNLGVIGTLNQAFFSPEGDLTGGIKNKFYTDNAYSTDTFNKFYENAEKAAQTAASNPNDAEAIYRNKQYNSVKSVVSALNQYGKDLGLEREYKIYAQQYVADFEKNDQIDKRIVRLLNRTGDKDILYDKSFSATYSIDGVKHTIPAEQYLDYIDEYYTEIEKAYDEILRYGYSDERTVAMLKQAKSDVEKKLKKKYKTGE